MFNWIVRFGLMAALLSASPGGAAAESDYRQVVGGVTIYLGVVPAALVQGHPRGHTEREMHGGVSQDGYHVMVALFEQATGERITDAQVSAQMLSASRPGPETRLEAMTIAGALTYGNYFAALRGVSYRIDVVIRRSGSPATTRATFNWRTQ